jgi:hypothetical protein
LTVGAFRRILLNLMEDFSLFACQGRISWCLKILHRVFGSAPTHCLLLLALMASCQTADPGERTVVQPGFFPDPTQFGTTIHPILQARCAGNACHGRQSTLRLHDAAEPLPSSPPITYPLQLPEPFRSDYFTVLYFVDLDLPADSELLRFGTGTETTHKGGAALSDAEAAAILNWLEADGTTP